MKRTAPSKKPETALNKHRDILLQIFGRVNIDLWDADYLNNWVLDHKKELGKQYREVRDWSYEVWGTIAEQEPIEPVKKYICRQCGGQRLRSGVIIADNSFICLKCAGYEL